MTSSQKTSQILADNLKQLADNHLKCDFGALQPKQKTKILSQLFVEKIMPAQGVDIADEFEDGFVDNANDLECDFAIKQGTNVYFGQSKYVGSGKSIKREQIDTFRKILERVSSDKFTPNHRLREVLAEIKWDRDTIYFYYVTSGRIDGQAKASSLDVDLPNLLVTRGLTADRLVTEYFDEDRLKEELRTIDAPMVATRDITAELHSIERNGKRLPIMEFRQSDLNTCIMVANADELATLYGQHHNNLFAYNIRNYLGETKKNKGIFDTAINDSSNFFFYNNGISAICDHFDCDGTAVTARGFSIINGAQTVRSLHRARGEINRLHGTQWDEKSKKPIVLLRITEIESHKERRGIAERIVNFNNTQNEIKTSDFRSNDNIQRSFGDQFSKLAWNGRKVEYRAKRADRRDKPTQTLIVDMVAFAKSVYSYLRDPFELTRNGANFLFDLTWGGEDASSNPYRIVFGERDGIIDREQFEYRAGIYFLALAFEELLKRKKVLLIGRPDDLNAIERKYIVLNVAGRLLRKDLQAREISIIRRLATEPWTTLDKHGLGLWVTELFETTCAFVISVYKQVIAEGVQHRAWIKGQGKVPQKIEATLLLPLRTIEPPKR